MLRLRRLCRAVPHGGWRDERRATRSPAGLACNRGPGVDAAAESGTRAARGRAVDLGGRLPRGHPAGAADDLRPGRRPAPRRRRREARLARAARHGADHHRRDPRAAGRADGAAVLALRRRAGRATSRSGSRRRSRRASATARSSAAARPTRSRTSSCTSGRCAPGGQAARRHQDRDRGPGGDGQRVHDLPADASPTCSPPTRW